MPFAAVLFDNDGLTLDTEPAWTRAETKLFARHGSTFTMEHKRSLLGTAPPVAAAKLEAMLGVPGDVLNAELHELVLVEVAAGVEPMPGAVDLLSALRAAGIPVGLVSNSRRWRSGPRPRSAPCSRTPRRGWPPGAPRGP